MEPAHHTKKIHVLITEVGSFLGTELAKSLLAQNCVVYGVGSSHLPHAVLANHDFTLLEIDLGQPLPDYLPPFNVIFDLSVLNTAKVAPSHIPHISPQTANIIHLSQRDSSGVFVVSPVRTSPDFLDHLILRSASDRNHQEDLKKRVNLLLLGDLYGPEMPDHENNELSKLIFQAIKSDKIILDNEGLRQVYPAYITDVIYAVIKIAFSENSKKVHFLLSEGAKTSLSTAYEIQNVMRVTTGKEIGLYFSGPEGHGVHEPEIIAREHADHVNPKVKLQEGLKNTIDYFVDKEEVHVQEPKPENKPQPTYTDKQDEVVREKEEKHKRIKAHVPRPSFASYKSFRKRPLFIALILITLFFAKMSLDLFFGASGLKGARTNLTAGNFQEAKENATRAKNSFASARNLVKAATYPFSFILPNQIDSINNSLEAAHYASAATLSFTEGSQSLQKNLQTIISSDTQKGDFDVETPTANFRKAYIESSRAKNLLENSKSLPFKGTLSISQQNAQKLNAISNSALEMTLLMEELTGNGAKKTYLVLIQNNTELRPGGGFIGNVAQVEFDGGQLKNISVEDVYTIDGQLKESIKPPPELTEKLGTQNLYLRDSNWTVDFEVNAKTARDFFKKETGKDVDGVIAIDLTYVQNILSKMGPVKLTDYNEEISADNLFERGEYHSEVGFFPGSTQKRDFFGSLTRTLIDKTLGSIKTEAANNQENTSPWLALVEATSEALSEKHLMLSFDSPTLSTFVKTKGWNNPLPPLTYNPADTSGQTRDFLALSEANLGANKVNRFIERKVSYEMTIGKDADLVGKLKINYKNNSPAETWPAGRYTNFLRVVVPFSAGLNEFKDAGQTRTSEVNTTSTGNYTVFSTFVEVPIKSEKEIIFTYHVPKNIKLESAPVYSLYIQKQPGTEKDPLEFKLNLPGYLILKSINGDETYSKSQNAQITTDLSRDREFKVEIGEK
ncbi:MAG: DUF4012 domain-containing protein [Candidatus Curtissbacteria bacterium]|nr:DUF4012 domain-containing protein [Candidatus Curtissbacteria bacterium]